MDGRQHIGVFVDRDGTLNEDHGYVTSPEELVLLPGIPQAMARLTALGVRVLLLTNQSAIGRNLISVNDLAKIHQKLLDLLRPDGGRIDKIYYCPHHPRDACDCRKPNIAMIQEAAQEFSLDLSHSYLVGDKLSDLEAAYRAGVSGVLVMSSEYSQEAICARESGQFPIDYVAETFVQAVDWIETRIRR